MDKQKFDRQWQEFVDQSVNDARFNPQTADQIAILDEDTTQTSIHIDWTYWIHCSWAARQLAKRKPHHHVDFGSYVYFAGIASAFVPLFEFIDVRPVEFPLPGLSCGGMDLTKLPIADNSLESISSMHVIEHIGLGRYGDKLDAQGDIQAAKELRRVLEPGGTLLFVAPMNEKPRVNFNAHRIYSFAQVSELFYGLSMEEYCFLHDDKVSHGGRGFPPGEYTGCFVFTKPKAMSA